MLVMPWLLKLMELAISEGPKRPFLEGTFSSLGRPTPGLVDPYTKPRSTGYTSLRK